MCLGKRTAVWRRKCVFLCVYKKEMCLNVLVRKKCVFGKEKSCF